MSLQDFLYGGAHALGGYLLQVCGKQVGQAGNCIEVLVPDVLLGEHALGYLAAVTSSAGVMVSSPRLPPL